MRRRGGEWRLAVLRAEDLPALSDLDDRFWLATSAPVRDFHSDPVFLGNLDSDGDGRIRCSDIAEAIRWLLRVLRPGASLEDPAALLDLDDLDTTDPDAARLRICAVRVLGNLGHTGARISLGEVRDRASILSRGERNGDGIVPPDCLGSGEVRQLALDVMATVGAAVDANGSRGVSEPLLDEFLA
jgi:hypothetical protein